MLGREALYTPSCSDSHMSVAAHQQRCRMVSMYAVQMPLLQWSLSKANADVPPYTCTKLSTSKWCSKFEVREIRATAVFLVIVIVLLVTLSVFFRLLQLLLPHIVYLLMIHVRKNKIENIRVPIDRLPLDILFDILQALLFSLSFRTQHHPVRGKV